ncbi:hypothetical protein DCS_07772 [Drechmeria coniospora]|uniref:PA14 domain-containing protein n=1 Tax=Drechmeria coniospora TaxID=98403 RepID=A0A151GFE3_DRECN|nr:hypothetical protein DCS_07772 [Drechmeria coniospora]KYK55808.1 hypothetical protein DCS_07772 [Drechmeria coniospora]
MIGRGPNSYLNDSPIAEALINRISVPYVVCTIPPTPNPTCPFPQLTINGWTYLVGWTGTVYTIPVDANNFTFVDQGYYVPPTTGVYTFCSLVDNGAYLFFGDGNAFECDTGIVDPNSVPILEQYYTSQPTGGSINPQKCVTKSLVAGYAYPFRFVFGQWGVGGYFNYFTVSLPGQPVINPADNTPDNFTGYAYPLLCTPQPPDKIVTTTVPGTRVGTLTVTPATDCTHPCTTSVIVTALPTGACVLTTLQPSCAPASPSGFKLYYYPNSLDTSAIGSQIGRGPNGYLNETAIAEALTNRVSIAFNSVGSPFSVPVNTNNFTFVDQGYYVPPTTGVYTFCSLVDNGAYLFLGDGSAFDCDTGVINPASVPLLEHYYTSEASGGSINGQKCVNKSLVADYAYPFRFVYGQWGGGFFNYFTVSLPGQPVINPSGNTPDDFTGRAYPLLCVPDKIVTTTVPGTRLGTQTVTPLAGCTHPCTTSVIVTAIPTEACVLATLQPSCAPASPSGFKAYYYPNDVGTGGIGSMIGRGPNSYLNDSPIAETLINRISVPYVVCTIPPTPNPTCPFPQLTINSWTYLVGWTGTVYTIPVDANNFTFVDQGYYVPPTTGIYTFCSLVDNGAYLFFGDGNAFECSTGIVNPASIPVLEQYYTSQPTGGSINGQKCVTKYLVAGFAYPFRFVFGQWGVGGYFNYFTVSLPGQPVINPADNTPDNFTGYAYPLLCG